MTDTCYTRDTSAVHILTHGTASASICMNMLAAKQDGKSGRSVQLECIHKQHMHSLLVCMPMLGAAAKCSSVGIQPLVRMSTDSYFENGCTTQECTCMQSANGKRKHTLYT